MGNDQCATCIHFFPGYGICKAFPDGIPDDIFLGNIDHNEPVEGDHGIQRLVRPEIEEIENS